MGEIALIPRAFESASRLAKLAARTGHPAWAQVATMAISHAFAALFLKNLGRLDMNVFL
jgi:hypothetical protein